MPAAVRRLVAKDTRTPAALRRSERAGRSPYGRSPSVLLNGLYVTRNSCGVVELSEAWPLRRVSAPCRSDERQPGRSRSRRQCPAPLPGPPSGWCHEADEATWRSRRGRLPFAAATGVRAACTEGL